MRGSGSIVTVPVSTVPLVINLRQDPFEVTMDSKMYTRWYGDKLWVILPS
ncbi:MAG TPA: hypothetical protein VKM56_07860 [Verrucomicrobiae bacterium]|nr:hypothetical protein [Verrucomicrobiae bacterium]